MMPVNTKLSLAEASFGSLPMRYADRSRIRAPKRNSQNLHSKGFGGGVPINTETAAVKPRVGIE
jgi:hypothetical protein